MKDLLTEILFYFQEFQNERQHHQAFSRYVCSDGFTLKNCRGNDGHEGCCFLIVTSLRFLHEVVSPLPQGTWGSGGDFWGISEFVSLITHGRTAPRIAGRRSGRGLGELGWGGQQFGAADFCCPSSGGAGSSCRVSSGGSSPAFST